MNDACEVDTLSDGYGISRGLREGGVMGGKEDVRSNGVLIR